MGGVRQTVFLASDFQKFSAAGIRSAKLTANAFSADFHRVIHHACPRPLRELESHRGLAEGPDLFREARVMPAPRKYTDELRERAVRMLEESLKESPWLAYKRACQRVGEQLGIPGSTLPN